MVPTGRINSIIAIAKSQSVAVILLIACGQVTNASQVPTTREPAVVSNRDNSTISLSTNTSSPPVNVSIIGINILEKNDAKTGEWSFDIVEHDLLEYLADLSNRNKHQPVAKVDKALVEEIKSQVEKSPDLGHKTAQVGDELPAEPEQYGIFDRFTRPRVSTSTTSRPSRDDTRHASESNTELLNVDEFNSEECGLRTYDVELDIFAPPADKRFPVLDESGVHLVSGQHKLIIAPPPPKVRQRLTHSDLERRRQQLQESLKKLLSNNHSNKTTSIRRQGGEATNPFGGSGDADDIFNNFRDHPSRYDPFEAPSAGGGEPKPSHDSIVQQDSSEVLNLAAKRQWLQQQLSHTLQLLGYSASSDQPGDFPLSGKTEEPNYIRDEMELDASIVDGDKATRRLGRSGASVESNVGAIIDAAAAASKDDEPKLEARVIGGSDARLGDSPWSVSLQALVSRPGTGAVEYRHFCGGSIISNHYILTAAHCLDFMVGREARLFVVLGDVFWRLGQDSNGRRITIDKLIIHSGYKSTAFGHDIGLIRTKESMRPVKIDGRYIVNSVCLPRRGVEHSGEAELVGWGLFSNRNEMSDSLQVASVPILPRATCVDLYRRRTGLLQWLIGIELITDKQVCAGTFGRGICQGDSGSALVFNEKPSQLFSDSSNREKPDYDDVVVEPMKLRGKKMLMRRDRSGQARATIIGVVAFGGIRRCSYQSLPGVYMQTSKYLDWILPRIQEE